MRCCTAAQSWSDQNRHWIWLVGDPWTTPHHKAICRPWSGWSETALYVAPTPEPMLCVAPTRDQLEQVLHACILEWLEWVLWVLYLAGGGEIIEWPHAGAVYNRNPGVGATCSSCLRPCVWGWPTMHHVWHGDQLRLRASTSSQAM